MASRKVAADQLLVERGLAADLKQAQALIGGGFVTTAAERIATAGVRIDANTELAVKSKPKYVSRGGWKLEHAIKALHVDFKEKTVLDVGSSTGGFTDCALQHGAKKVYALDVGTNQLAYRLRVDPRVVAMEKTHFKTVVAATFADPVDIALCDVAFISCKGVFATLAGLTPLLLVLIKPQFEATRGEMANSGGRADPALHSKVVDEVRQSALAAGWHIVDYTRSPVLGKAKGNVEYLALFDRNDDGKAGR